MAAAVAQGMKYNGLCKEQNVIQLAGFMAGDYVVAAIQGGGNHQTANATVRDAENITPRIIAFIQKHGRVVTDGAKSIRTAMLFMHDCRDIKCRVKLIGNYDGSRKGVVRFAIRKRNCKSTIIMVGSSFGAFCAGLATFWLDTLRNMIQKLSVCVNICNAGRGGTPHERHWCCSAD